MLLSIWNRNVRNRFGWLLVRQSALCINANVIETRLCTVHLVIQEKVSSLLVFGENLLYKQPHLTEVMCN